MVRTAGLRKILESDNARRRDLNKKLQLLSDPTLEP